MAKNLEFLLLETTDQDEFCRGVQEKLNSGWELHGHVIAVPNYTEEGKAEGLRYLQAFVKDATPRHRTGFVTAAQD